MQVDPGKPFTAAVDGFDTGLAGTLAVRIENADGTNHTPRTTAGVVEIEAGSGSYTKRDLVAPTLNGRYVVLWDTGGPDPVWAGEELRVGSSLLAVEPGETFVAVASFPTGLTGTLGVRIENPDGTTQTARATTGIVEVEPGAGIYTATLVAPDGDGAYVVLWDDGAGSFASEDLAVSSQARAGFYCSAEDVRQALAPEGQEDQSTAGQMSDDAIYREISNAQSEIDSQLRDRYTVPFEDGQVPVLVKAVTTDIAAYLATLTHRRAGEITEDDTVRLRYTRATGLVEKLGAGAVDLDTPPAEADAFAADPTVVNDFEGDLFTTADFDVLPHWS